MAGIEQGANKYIHPNNSNTRHVTDAEKTKWNNNSITAYKASKGYVKLGGIMVQWGTSYANANTNTSVSYATLFGSVYSVVMCPEDGNTGQNKSLAVYAIGTSTFQINNTERVGFNCRWIAIGTY